MSKSRGIISIGSKSTVLDEKTQKHVLNPPTARLKSLISHFNGLSAGDFDSLQNGYFEPAPAEKREAAIKEIMQAIFGSRKSKDSAAVVFKQLCDTEESTPASWARWLNERGMDQLKNIFVGTAIVEDDVESSDEEDNRAENSTSDKPRASLHSSIESENARWQQIMRAIKKLTPQKASILDTRADEILRAYTALVLAALHGSGEAVAALSDSLFNGYFDFSALGDSQLHASQLRVAQIRYFVTLHIPKILRGPTAEISDQQREISQLQTLRGITKYLADWKNEVQDTRDDKTYLAILTLLNKVQEWLPDTQPTLKAASDFLLHKSMPKLSTAQNELVEIQALGLALLVELAPGVSRIMTQQIAAQKVAQVDSSRTELKRLQAQLQAAQAAHDAMVHPHDRRYPTKKIFTKTFNEINDQARKDALIAEYNKDRADSQTAINTAQAAIAEYEANTLNPAIDRYNAMKENFSVNDPIVVVTRRLLLTIEKGIFSFSRVSGLLKATNLSADSRDTSTLVQRKPSSITSMLESFISGNMRDFSKNGLPQRLIDDSSFYPLHQISNNFKDNLQVALYQNDKDSNSRGTVAQSATAKGDILLQHPMIAAFFLVRKLKIEHNLGTLSEHITLIREQIFVAVQNIEANFDLHDASSFAIKLRSYLLISAALLLDPIAIMTLRYEASSNPLSLENIDISADFHNTLRKIGSAEPSYDDALSLLAQLKIMLQQHPVYGELHQTMANASLTNFVSKELAGQRGHILTAEIVKKDFGRYIEHFGPHSRQNSQESSISDGLASVASSVISSSNNASDHGAAASAVALVHSSSSALYSEERQDSTTVAQGTVSPSFSAANEV